MWSYRGAALGWVDSKIGPIVTVNQSDGPVTVSSGDEVEVAVKLYPSGNKLGMEADWWVAVSTAAGWCYFGPDGNWHPENDIAKWRPVCQGALGDLNAMAIWRSTTLLAGDYTFYFGVDERNGKVDDGMWVDAAQLSVR